MIQKKGCCQREGLRIREWNATTATPHISCRHNRDQQPDCGGKERGDGLLRPWAPAGVSTWEGDVRAFRLFTSQMIVNGTVKRYVKVMRERGSEGFYVRQARHSSASVLKGEVLERAQQLLDKGRSVPEVAGELKVLANTLHKAIRAGRLLKKRIPHRTPRN